MKHALNLVWRFKWIPLGIILIELALYFPVIWLMRRFGESSFTYNLTQTPFGSSEFVGVMIDAMKLDSSMSNAIVVFAVLIPVLFILKLALTAGTYSVMQNDNRRIRAWLSATGEYSLKSIGLFLRWLIVPIILLLVPALLTIPKISWLSGIAIGLMVLGWLFALSILNHGLIILVRDEKKSLRKAIAVFKSCIVQVLIAIVLLVLLMAMVHVFSMQLLQWNSDPGVSEISAILLSLMVALGLRFVILFWQAQHLQMAKS